MLAMLLAVVVTLLDQQILSFTYIFVGLIIGSAIGAVVAKKIQMTQMPEMVALFNGLGGAASALVASAEFFRGRADVQISILATICLSVLIGTVTLSGSLIAFAKLKGIMKGAPITYRGQHVINGLIVATVLAFSIMLVLDPSNWPMLVGILGLAAVLGVTSVIPIGGADMPVVISQLNS